MTIMDDVRGLIAQWRDQHGMQPFRARDLYALQEGQHRVALSAISNRLPNLYAKRELSKHRTGLYALAPEAASPRADEPMPGATVLGHESRTATHGERLFAVGWADAVASALNGSTGVFVTSDPALASSVERILARAGKPMARVEIQLGGQDE